MFPRPLNQCSNLKRHQYWQNQSIFASRLPIDFFYFADFGWPFFGKITGQKCYLESAFVASALKEKALSFSHSLIIRKIYLHLHKVGCASTKKVNFLCPRLALPLHKVGCASTKKINFLCLRLALPLHKVGCASTKKVNFLCLRLALPLDKRDFALAISGLTDCVRLVLFLHKIGYASTKKVNFLCVQLALSLMCKKLTA